VAFSDCMRRIASRQGSWEGAWGLAKEEAMLEVLPVVVSEHELVLRFVSIVVVAVVEVVAVELMLRLSKSSATSSTVGCMMGGGGGNWRRWEGESPLFRRRKWVKNERNERERFLKGGKGGSGPAG
jgi:hypothetical protein